MITPQDLRSAIARGIITPEQAASLTALASDRHLARDEAATRGEEPFVLFRGFNEIFIVIGMAILFAAWHGITTAALWQQIGQPPSATTFALHALTLVGLWFGARYFTTARRMIAPSIALSIMTAWTAHSMGGDLGRVLNLAPVAQDMMASGVTAAVCLLHYLRFRVPFSAALITLAGFTTFLHALSLAGLMPDNLWQEWWSGQLNLASWLIAGFGVAVFGLAMQLDLSDPLRVTTRSSTAFWLHVAAAPMIVNPFAMALLSVGTTGAHLALAAFLGLLALVALTIDRRSFLVSGAGYGVALAFTLFDDAIFTTIFALGAGLIWLGAQWERLRRAWLNALPDFPAKRRLPPYED